MPCTPPAQPSPTELFLTRASTAYMSTLEAVAGDHIVQPPQAAPQRLHARLAVPLAAQESPQPGDPPHRVAEGRGGIRRHPGEAAQDLQLPPRQDPPARLLRVPTRLV